MYCYVRILCFNSMTEVKVFLLLHLLSKLHPILLLNTQNKIDIIEL